MLIQKKINPGLLGIEHSNRDFTNSEYWGKNQFNSSFPAALACYMHLKGINPIYLTLNQKLQVVHSQIPVKTLFGLQPFSKDLFFAFETQYSSYAPYIVGNVPRADLVTLNRGVVPNQMLKALEVKLTALPDNTTCLLTDAQYGCEIVVRPDTIVYLTLGLAEAYRNQRNILFNQFDPIAKKINDWEEINQVLPYVRAMADAIDKILLSNLNQQIPILMQPIWKTVGKSSVLADQCFDIFVWSDFAFTRLFTNTARRENLKTINRNLRSVVWLFKMLYDFSVNGSVNFSHIIDRLTYNTKNDKAFAVAGAVTNPYMKCNELTTPRIHKNAVKEIILGGGQNFLSPERRLDAIILNTPGLF
jgi:hypothetical protein